MINNFYFFPSEGPLVSYRKLHIGRERLFYQFQFQAYREPGGVRSVKVDSETGLRLDVDVPAIQIMSYADWRTFLRSHEGVIKDGREVVYSAEAFEARVAENAPDIKELLNPLRDESRYRRIDRYLEWNDEERFSFSLRVFG